VEERQAHSRGRRFGDRLGPRSVTVDLKTAPYSLAELEKAQARIMDRIRDNPSPLHGVKIPVEGTGLVVSALPGTPDVAAKAARTADAADAGVPVTTVVEPPLQASSRADDAPPWKGAAQIRNTFRAACASGFGVTFFGNADYVVTASHCSLDPALTGFIAQAFGDETGEFIGNSSTSAGQTRLDHDILLIGPTSAGNVIYDGPVGAGEFTKRVSGWANTTVGERVCVSAARSGVNCNIINRSTNVSFCYNIIPWLCPNGMVQAEVTSGTPPAAGNSGSPFFVPTPDTAVAKGVYGGFTGNQVVYQDFGTINADFAVTPKT
jgi:hypothetical protein